MDLSNNRQSACDRCRGQKLRCTGLANPTLDRHSKYVRNQTPCDRCRKAQVDCYSVRSFPRRRAVSRSLSSSTSSTRTPPDYLAPCIPTKSPQLSVFRSESHPWANNGNIHAGQTVSSPGHTSMDSLGADVIPELSNSSLQENPFDFAIESFLAEEGNAHEDSSMSSDSLASSVQVEKRPEAAMATDDFRQLAELHGNLLQARANRCEMGQDCQNKDRTNASQNGIVVSLSIGQTLRHCQHLLGILQNIQRNVASQASEASWQATRSDYGLAFPLAGTMSDCSSQGNLPASPLDLFPLFSILSCYSCVMEDLETLFSAILKALRQAAPRVPATLVGTSLDGFNLDGNNTLQLEFLLYISSNLLQKIEKILMGAAGEYTGDSNNDSLLSGEMAGYLKSLYKSTDHSLEDSTGERNTRAKALILEIEEALRNLER